MCFFGSLRSGENTVLSERGYDEGAHLSFNDIAVDSIASSSTVRIRIKASKTDPFRIGMNIFLGRTGDSISPVAALLKFMTARGNGTGLLFGFQNSKLLMRDSIVCKVKEALVAAGIDPTPCLGHSFRSGAATTASSRGISDTTIKMLGRCKSNAYQLYIKTPREQLAAVSRRNPSN